MTKVKTFEFKISAFFGNSKTVLNPKDRWYDLWSRYIIKHSKKTDPERLWSSEEIDKKINDFIADKNLIEIKYDYVTTSNHNNGGDNDVFAFVKILYKEE